MSRLPLHCQYLLINTLFFTAPASAQYLKIDPPPDSNKREPAADISCWLHTAANMLAGADYGTGTTVQDRADEIFGELNSSAYLASHG